MKAINQIRKNGVKGINERKEIEILGVKLKTYKHESYDGNVGIYLIDGVSRIGEIINGTYIFRSDFSKIEKDWLKRTQDEKTLNLIFQTR